MPEERTERAAKAAAKIDPAIRKKRAINAAAARESKRKAAAKVANESREERQETLVSETKSVNPAEHKPTTSAEKILKPCLVIAPIGEVGTDIRKHSDQTLRHIIRPAAARCGFHAQRSDEIASPVLITHEVVRRIASDELVIADLTGANGNVMYELAIRHVTRKPLVTLVSGGDRLPFDVMNSKTIFFDLTDPDSVETAGQHLQAHINAVIEKPDSVENPISAALDLASRISGLETSKGAGTNKELAAILDQLAQLSSRIGELQRQTAWQTYKSVAATTPIFSGVSNLADTLRGGEFLKSVAAGLHPSELTKIMAESAAAVERSKHILKKSGLDEAGSE